MIDIETLGLEPGAAILSIGAVRFTSGGVGETFERSISLSSCEDAGLSIDAETLEWWLSQDAEAQQVLAGGDELPQTLWSFAEWFDDADEIWANSPSFDCAMLAEAYDAINQQKPWDYYQERDFRTLKKIPGAVQLDQDGVEHDALDDARHQARVASMTLSRLQERDS